MSCRLVSTPKRLQIRGSQSWLFRMALKEEQAVGHLLAGPKPCMLAASI